MWGLISMFLPVGRVLSLLGQALMFLRSPVGMIASVVLLVMLARCDARRDGFREAQQICKSEEISAQLAEAKRQLEATELVSQENKTAATEADNARAELQKKVDGYENEIDKTSSCTVSDFTRERVQQIRNSR